MQTLLFRVFHIACVCMCACMHLGRCVSVFFSPAILGTNSLLSLVLKLHLNIRIIEIRFFENSPFSHATLLWCLLAAYRIYSSQSHARCIKIGVNASGSLLRWNILMSLFIVYWLEKCSSLTFNDFISSGTFFTRWRGCKFDLASIYIFVELFRMQKYTFQKCDINCVTKAIISVNSLSLNNQNQLFDVE